MRHLAICRLPVAGCRLPVAKCLSVRVFMILAAAVVGCAAPRFTPTLRYTVEPPLAPAASSVTEGALGIRALPAARPYKQAIVYRDAGHVLGVYDTAEWAELPGAVVTRALTDALEASRRFRDVGDAANLAMPDYILTGELRKFDLVRSEQPWKAECEVRLELRKGLKREPVWSATLNAQETLAGNDVAALPEAMSRAVSKLVSAATAAIIGQALTPLTP